MGSNRNSEITPIFSNPIGVDASGHLVPGEPVAQFELGSMRNFVYLILDWKSVPGKKMRAAIVDPQKDIDTPLRALEREGFTLDACFLTHSHHDHVAGVGPLLERFPELPLYVHEGDRFRLKKIPPETKLRLIHDGEVLSVGDLEVEALHTPGHSAGEISYFVKATPPRVLTGDTLFIRDCGRTDLETGNDEQLFESLQRLKRLPAETWILPGHHYAPEYASTLNQELRTSPPLLCKNADELRNLP